MAEVYPCPICENTIKGKFKIWFHKYSCKENFKANLFKRLASMPVENLILVNKYVKVNNLDGDE